MHSYTVDWKRVVSVPALLGLLGLFLILAGFFAYWLPAELGGSIVCLVALHCYIYRTWDRGNFISLADTYMLLYQRKKAYIFHASEIEEIIYGNNIRLRFHERWFDLNCFIQGKQFQNALVQFAVHNRIFVHAADFKGQGQGKYARLRLAKQ